MQLLASLLQSVYIHVMLCDQTSVSVINTSASYQEGHKLKSWSKEHPDWFLWFCFVASGKCWSSTLRENVIISFHFAYRSLFTSLHYSSVLFSLSKALLDEPRENPWSSWY
jgi:hypothetical protein